QRNRSFRKWLLDTSILPKNGFFLFYKNRTAPQVIFMTLLGQPQMQSASRKWGYWREIPALLHLSCVKGPTSKEKDVNLQALRRNKALATKRGPIRSSWQSSPEASYGCGACIDGTPKGCL
ncbi:hypothetical protein, partial [Cohnella sp. GCM10012308]|uniref:hypothetical protein n=1 Tax=Cohnella sp. GCM10012308 TaxID=3317329 RepID=UPI00361871C2